MPPLASLVWGVLCSSASPGSRVLSNYRPMSRSLGRAAQVDVFQPQASSPGILASLCKLAGLGVWGGPQGSWGGMDQRGGMSQSCARTHWCVPSMLASHPVRPCRRRPRRGAGALGGSEAGLVWLETQVQSRLPTGPWDRQARARMLLCHLPAVQAWESCSASLSHSPFTNRLRSHLWGCFKVSAAGGVCGTA